MTQRREEEAKRYGSAFTEEDREDQRRLTEACHAWLLRILDVLAQPREERR